MTDKILTGAYPGGYVLNNANYSGLVIDVGASVGGHGVYSSGTTSITNLGSVTADSSHNGVQMGAGGSLINGSASLISGGGGVQVSGASSTVANFGTIQGTAGAGVVQNTGGALNNGSAADTSAVISGSQQGILAYGSAPMVITNFGTISGKDGKAVILGQATDLLVVEAGAVFNGELVANGAGQGALGGSLELAGGSDTIAGFDGTGTMTGATSLSFIGVNHYVVDSGATLTLDAANDQGPAYAPVVSGSLINIGDINTVLNGGEAGVLLNAGGSVTNGSAADTTARIKGIDGIDASGGSVANFGVISGQSANGVILTGPASVTNGAVGDTGADIYGDTGLLAQSGTATIANFGVINGNKYGGVFVYGGGLVTNGSATDIHAVIEGPAGVTTHAGQAATVINFGTIIGEAGGTAVDLKSASDRLIVESTAAFVGKLVGGGGTLEAAGGADTITGLGGAGAMTGNTSASFSGFATYQVDVGGTWTLSGTNTLAAGTTLTDKGTLIDTGALSLSAGARLAVANGGVLQIEGAVSNAGTIALTSTGAQSDLRVLAAGATLSGGGTVSLSGSKAGILGASSSATLTNADNTLSGAGFIGAAKMTLINEASGVIDANAKGGIALRTDGKTLANAGLMEATGSGQLDIINTTVDDSKGGKISAAARIDIQNSDIIGGAMTSSGAGVLVVNALGAVLDGTSGHAVTMSGRLYLLDDTSLTLEGSIIDKGGSITVTGGAHQTQLLVAVAGATLSGGGTVDFTNRALNHIDAAGAGAVLTNLDNHIVGAGTIGDANMTLVNDAAGFITSNDSVALTIDTGAHTIVNAGRIDGDGKGGTIIQSAVSNTGLLVALHGNLTVNGAVTGGGSAEILGGTLAFASSFSENVTFTSASPNGVLQLAQSVGYTGTITGFSHTANATKLDLRDIAFKNGSTKATAVWSQSTGILTVTNGAKTARIHLAGNYTGSTFTTADDTHGGVFITDPPAPPAAPHPASPPRPTHPFVAAMAGFASGAPGALAAGHETWRPPLLTLAATRAQMA